jgi:hypothetical protein
LFKFKIRRGGGGFLIKHTSTIKIDFIPNNFRFDKNMQGYGCMMMHDVKMTRKRK